MIRSVFTFTTAGHTLPTATTAGSDAGSFSRGFGQAAAAVAEHQVRISEKGTSHQGYGKFSDSALRHRTPAQLAQFSLAGAFGFFRTFSQLQ